MTDLRVYLLASAWITFVLALVIGIAFWLSGDPNAIYGGLIAYGELLIFFNLFWMATRF